VTDNLDALGRLRGEPGWAGVFTREQAPGALPNGSTVMKTLDAPGDSHELGARATVLGSIGPQPESVDVGDRVVPAGAYVYFVEWEDAPRAAVAVTSDRVGYVPAVLRALLLDRPELRQRAAEVIEAMLVDLADLDDDDELPEWAAVLEPAVLATLDEVSVAGLRSALRSSLEVFADRDR
jgi:hypothetical protein